MRGERRGMEDNIELRKGWNQGCVMSPQLFISSLIKWLDRGQRGEQ